MVQKLKTLAYLHNCIVHKIGLILVMVFQLFLWMFGHKKKKKIHVHYIGIPYLPSLLGAGCF